MRLTIFIGLALTAGCGEAKPPSLQLRGVGVPKVDGPKLNLLLKLANVGGDVALVDAVQPVVVDSETIQPPGSVDAALDQVQLELAIYYSTDPTPQLLPQLREGEAVPIGPQHDATLTCKLGWALPPSSPPMIALVAVDFVVSYNGKEPLRSGPRLLVLESEPGVLDHVVKSATDPQQALAIMQRMDAMHGRRSTAFRSLRERMMAMAKPVSGPQ